MRFKPIVNREFNENKTKLENENGRERSLAAHAKREQIVAAAHNQGNST